MFPFSVRIHAQFVIYRFLCNVSGEGYSQWTVLLLLLLLQRKVIAFTLGLPWSCVMYLANLLSPLNYTPQPDAVDCFVKLVYCLEFITIHLVYRSVFLFVSCFRFTKGLDHTQSSPLRCFCGCACLWVERFTFIK